MYLRSILEQQSKFASKLAGTKQFITIDSKDWIELVDAKYTLSPFNLPQIVATERPAPPLEIEISERAHIIRRTGQCCDLFKADRHTRRAAFANSFDGADNHCMSYFHFFIRNNLLILNVYARSQNFETNWMWDNMIYSDCVKFLHYLLKRENIHCDCGQINVHVASLHIPYERSQKTV